jgi:4-hydroxy-tetrahydrodipicolinate reductase
MMPVQESSQEKIKISLIGFGQMGQAIERLSKNDPRVDVHFVADESNNRDGEALQTDIFKSSDVAIDFSHPSVVLKHIEFALDAGVPLVVGTTGWNDKIDTISTKTHKVEGKVVYGSNFSLGVQLFIKLAQKAGELFKDDEFFDVTLHETHHIRKADAPSGTAITLAENVLKGQNSDKEITYGIPENHPIDTDNFYVTSQRRGSVFGEHSIDITSLYDNIQIKHEARSRDGFAAGALKTAVWLTKQKPGFYLIEDIVEDILG